MFQDVLKCVRKMKWVFGITVTFDPTLFESPEHCYRWLMESRVIAQYVRSLKRAGVIHSEHYFAVLEFHKSGWPHWHILVDANEIKKELLQKYWDKYRPKNAGPVEPGRPGLGWVAYSPPPEGPSATEKAAWYACKYLTKVPENGFPEWAKNYVGELRLFKASRGFWTELGGRKKREKWVKSESSVQRKQKATARERMESCGTKAIVYAWSQKQVMGGVERKGRAWPVDASFEDVAEYLGQLGIDPEKVHSGEELDRLVEAAYECAGKVERPPGEEKEEFAFEVGEPREVDLCSSDEFSLRSSSWIDEMARREDEWQARRRERRKHGA